MEPSIRYNESRRITLYGAAKNAVLAIIKIIFGITGHSHALVADGVHSFSDLIVDAVVLVASRFGSKAADADHPYGHGRIETAATVLLGVILAVAGIGIIWDAGYEIWGNRLETVPDFYVLLVALLSVFINEVLYRYTRAVGERIKSNLLISNAWHHRSDSASSLVVLIGVLGAWLGFRELDAIAAMVVGGMIIKMAWEFAWKSVRELVDTALDEVIVSQIREIITSVPGVRELHQLRTRSVGSAIFLDVHILVDPFISVSEGHFIGQQVHVRLMKEVADISDVTVHVDPEDDEVTSPSLNLPTRQAIIELLKTRWAGLLSFNDVEKIMLHYLAGKIVIDIYLKSTSDELAQKKQVLSLQEALRDVSTIEAVNVFFSLFSLFSLR